MLRIPSRLRATTAASLLALLGAPAPAAVAASAIGAETCRACHPLAYQAWKAGPHARALDAVPPARRGDARCMGCHAPDGERAGAGVGCETCHGPGSVYGHAYVMRDPELARAVGLVARPGERSCLGCHTDATPSLGRFDYQQKLRVIAHGGDREARAVPARQGAP